MTETKTQVALAPGLEMAAINLARHAERGQEMLRQAEALGLPLRLFEGFDAGGRPEQDLLPVVPPIGVGGPMPPKDRGCTASHLLLLAEFLKGEGTHFLVLEDDVVLTEDLVPWLRDLSWWPEGADVVRLEAWGDRGKFHVIGRTAQQHLGRDLVRLYSMHPGTAAYIITRDAAARVVDWTGRLALPIDHFLFNAGVSPFGRHAQVWQMRPALFRQVLPPGEGIARNAEKRRGWQGLKDGWDRGIKDLGGVPRSLPGLLSGRRRLVRPL